MPALSANAPLPLHQPHRSHHDKNPRKDPERNSRNWHIRKPVYGPRRLQAKNHLVAAVGEYVGTLLFLFLAFGGTTVANLPTNSVTGAETSGSDASVVAAPNTSSLLYIAFSFGFSLLVCVAIFFRVSGGLFNPAVAVGMLIAGALSPVRMVVLIISQILGGISGAALIEAMLPGTLNVRTLRGGGISIARAFWLETFLTGVLMLAILLLAATPNKAKHLAPIVIGFALFVCELVGVYWTGGSLNPVRSFGPSVVVKRFSGYHWIFWLGPILGASIAAVLYRILVWLEYETVLGSDKEDSCNHPIIQVNTNTGSINGGSDAATPTTSNVDNGHNGYNVEGTGFGDAFHPGDDDSSDILQRIDIPNYDARFERLEGMMAQLLEAGQYPGGRTSGESHGWGGARKSSVAGTLVEEPTNEKFAQA
ncbi:hypothetical protein JCM10207_003110 [Rhodosporidiobolus poonsookiae]